MAQATTWYKWHSRIHSSIHSCMLSFSIWPSATRLLWIKDDPLRLHRCEGADAVMVFISINGQRDRVDNFCGHDLPNQVMSSGSMAKILTSSFCPFFVANIYSLWMDGGWKLLERKKDTAVGVGDKWGSSEERDTAVEELKKIRCEEKLVNKEEGEQRKEEVRLKLRMSPGPTNECQSLTAKQTANNLKKEQSNRTRRA